MTTPDIEKLRGLAEKWRKQAAIRKVEGLESTSMNYCAADLEAAGLPELLAYYEKLLEWNKELQSEFAIASRACGNWREFPETIVSKDTPDWEHEDWKAATRAIMERDKLLADCERLLKALQIARQTVDEWVVQPDGRVYVHKDVIEKAINAAIFNAKGS